MHQHIAVAGDDLVGKTSLIINFISKQPPECFLPKLMEEQVETLVINDEQVTLHIFDVNDITPGLFAERRVDGVVLCYAVDNKGSFDRAVNVLLPKLKAAAHDMPVVFVGLKNDLRRRPLEKPESQLVDEHVAREALRTFNGLSGYFETSHGDYAATERIFRHIADEVAARKATSHYVLCGDIGGTNARLQLWRAVHREDLTAPVQLDGTEPAFRQTYRVVEYHGYTPILARFLQDAAGVTGGVEVVAASLAVCGPVWDNGRRNDPNNMLTLEGKRWEQEDAHMVETALNIHHGALVFINDFEAIAYALAALHHPDAPELCKIPGACLTELHKGEPAARAAIGCLGAGTGLGAAFLVHDGKQYIPCPSEAGMTDSFSPKNEREWRLKQHLQRLYGPYVEVERILSGQGLVDVYTFLCGEHIATTVAAADEIAAAAQDLKPAVVSEAARKGDFAALAAVDLFLDVYGRELGSTAQRFMCFQGLYIAGGMLPKMMWRARDGDRLVRAYREQGPKMTEFVSKVPLWLMDDEDVGIRGALWSAISRRW